MRKAFLVLFALILVFLERGGLSFPMVLPLLLVFYVITNDYSVFWVAFLLGFLCDILFLRPIAITSMYFLLTLYVVMLYEKKFEARTLPFVMLFSFLSVIIYLIIFGQSSIFQKALLSCIFAAFSFVVYNNFTKNSLHDTHL